MKPAVEIKCLKLMQALRQLVKKRDPTPKSSSTFSSLYGFYANERILIPLGSKYSTAQNQKIQEKDVEYSGKFK